MSNIDEMLELLLLLLAEAVDDPDRREPRPLVCGPRPAIPGEGMILQ